MENLEYLEKIKEDGFRKYIIEKSSDDLESRKALALEIIAETLISIDDNLKIKKAIKSKETRVKALCV